MTSQQTVPQVIIQPLTGRHIVVTRPTEQAGPLAAAIDSAGGNAVLFPVLTILGFSDPQLLVDIATRLEDFDLVVYVSPNAVKQALPRILAQRLWPTRLRVATVGKASEHALACFGITDVIAPQARFDSEALLGLPELQEMSGKRVVVFRGDGGRDLLGDTLSRRGAKVEFVACYRRGKPGLNAGPLLQLWARHELDAITITSSEGLRNLCDMVGKAGQTALADTPLFLPHARIVEQARRLGMKRLVATAPGDEGLMAGLIEYFTTSTYDHHTMANFPESARQNGN